MTMTYKRQLDNIYKRINQLNLDKMQLVLDFITNIEGDNNELYYIVKVLDKNNKVVEQSDKIYDKPKGYIEKYIDKYNLTPRIDFYNIINGELVYIPTLLEQEQLDANRVE